MGNEGAALIVQDERLRFSRGFSVERMKKGNSILQAAVGTDQQSFIGYGRATKHAALENRQRLTFQPRAGNTDFSTNRYTPVRDQHLTGRNSAVLRCGQSRTNRSCRQTQTNE